LNRRRCDIVIPTRNRPVPLRHCLDALRRQTVKDFRVIVVDDGSEPALAEVIDDYDQQSLDVIFVTNAQPLGPAAARNRGVEHSEADFVIFLDDDVRPNPEFVQVHLDAVTAAPDPAHPIVSFGPFVEPADWEPNVWSRWEAMQTTKEVRRIESGELVPGWRNCHTGNNCVPRDVFNEVGGFNEAFKRYEDDELAIRLVERGCLLTYVPGAKAFHYPNRSVESWLDLARLYTYFDQVIEALHPHLGYLAIKQGELEVRHPVTRLARSVIGRGRLRTELAVAALLSVARASYRLGLVKVPMGALSVAYDALVQRTFHTVNVTEDEIQVIRGNVAHSQPMCR
jgi:GT2 family glycosyltransferase